MVKRIIFDLDNTLIPLNLKDVQVGLFGLLKKNDISLDHNLLSSVLAAIAEYDATMLRYDYKQLTDYINEKVGINLPKDFLYEVTVYLSDKVPEKDLKLIELLEYLSSKYSLVVATNWFTNQQISKLKNYGIYEYFDEVITGEDFDLKPRPAMFEHLKNGFLDNEVIVVGDGYNTDIIGAINSNLYSYFITNDTKYVTNDKYTVISNIYELKDYL